MNCKKQQKAEIEKTLMARKRELLREEDLKVTEQPPDRHIDRITRGSLSAIHKAAAAVKAHKSRQLKKIEFALERLRSGVFGTCMRCGEIIEPKRLNAIPETESCLECMSQRELVTRRLPFNVRLMQQF